MTSGSLSERSDVIPMHCVAPCASTTHCCWPASLCTRGGGGKCGGGGRTGGGGSDGGGGGACGGGDGGGRTGGGGGSGWPIGMVPSKSSSSMQPSIMLMSPPKAQ